MGGRGSPYLKCGQAQEPSQCCCWRKGPTPPRAGAVVCPSPRFLEELLLLLLLGPEQAPFTVQAARVFPCSTPVLNQSPIPERPRPPSALPQEPFEGPSPWHLLGASTCSATAQGQP